MNRRGNCYVTCEALYHLLGGPKSGWRPMVMRHEGDTHWFLAKRVIPPGGKGRGIQTAAVNMPLLIVLDPTFRQFKTAPDYQKARGCGFLTKKPSKRARELAARMLWQYPERPTRSRK